MSKFSLPREEWVLTGKARVWTPPASFELSEDWMDPLQMPVQDTTHPPTQSNIWQNTALQIIIHVNNTRHSMKTLWEDPVQVCVCVCVCVWKLE